MVICIWNKCNSRCIMCTNPSDFWKSDIYTQDFLEQRILGIGKKLKKNEEILLTGGEPTIHPQFLEILNFTRKTYPNNQIELLSNGRRFVYKEFAHKVMQMPNLTLMISLSGYDSKTHDKITRSEGSFQQTIEGLKNIFFYFHPSLNQKVEIRIVITKINYKYLTKILDLIRKKFFLVDRVILIFLEVEGQGRDNFDQVGLTYKQFNPFFERYLSIFYKIERITSLSLSIMHITSKILASCLENIARRRT